MNIIVIVSDTMRWDHLGCYGNKWIKTPNIDGLARESVVFDRAYAASFPTVPNRKDVFTGRYTFTYTGWSPLEKDAVVFAPLVRQAGYVTMLVVDTPHIMRDGFYFDRGFDGWLWIRGQEGERYSTDPVEVRFPCAPEKLRNPQRTVVQYMRNTSQWRGEADHFCAQTMTAAANWLERNHTHEKFLLYVDTFDPHEPWDPPKWYVDLYDPGYEGEEVYYPVYGRWKDFMTEAELRHARALYAGEVTLVDRWIGVLLRRVEELGLMENTAIIFTTDHGFYHGEHGLIGKSIITPKVSGQAALYEEVAHIPLMIRLPDSKGGERCQALVQSPDLMPTILELAGARIPETVQGRSMLPLVRGEKPSWREIAVTSPSIVGGPVSGQRITVTSDEWALIYPGQIGEALKARPPGPRVRARLGEAPTVERLQEFLGKIEPELFHLSKDPRQTRNLFGERKDIAEELHSRLVRFLEGLGPRRASCASGGGWSNRRPGPTGTKSLLYGAGPYGGARRRGDVSVHLCGVCPR